MELTAYQMDVYLGKICPYCRAETKIVSETFIYGKEYKGRKMICCKNFPLCDSFVGTHDDGTTLGRLANKELRQYKKVAHDNFDKIWRENGFSRNGAYQWLSETLEIPLDFTHIGFFNIQTCKIVIKECYQLNKDIESGMFDMSMGDYET